MTQINLFFLLITTLLSLGCATGEVNDGNQAPVANLGDDYMIEVGQVIKLNGGLSFDKDGDELTYRWELKTPKDSKADLSSTNFVSTQFTIDVSGVYVVKLVVNDGLVDSAPDKLTLKTAMGENAKPTARIDTLEKKFPFGKTIKFDGSPSTDPEGETLTYDWLIEGAPEESVSEFDNSKAKSPTFSPDFPGEYEISLVVSDGTSKSDPAVVIFEVEEAANNAPIADPGADREVALNDRVQLDGSKSTDPEKSTLSYTWMFKSRPTGSNASLSNKKIANPTFVADQVGDFVIELIVSDGKLSSPPVLIKITSKKGNLSATADAGLDIVGVVGKEFVLNGSGSNDPEGQALVFSWTLTKKPAGSVAVIAVSNQEEMAFTADLPGQYIFSLVVNDGEVDSAADTINVMIEPANTAPVAKAGADVLGSINDPLILDGSLSTDSDGDSLTYLWTWTSKPIGSATTFDDSTSSTPVFTPDKNGDYVVSLVVNDGKLDSNPDEIKIVVGFEIPSQEGDLVITEYMPDPRSIADNLGEWVEFYNPTGKTYELKNCELSDLDGDSHIIRNSIIVAPMSYVVLARSSTPGFTPKYVYSGFALGNGGDEIILTCNTKEISNILFDNTFPHPTGASVALLDAKRNEIDNDNPASWCVSTDPIGNGDFGTPGAANMLATCP